MARVKKGARAERVADSRVSVAAVDVCCRAVVRRCGVALSQ